MDKLLFLTFLVLADSGIAQFANNLHGDLNFLCPSDRQVVTSIYSVFDFSFNDRTWSYGCGSGGGLANVTATCSLQPPINTLEGTIRYDCPDDGYFGGFASTFDPSPNDREWSPYCCTRPHAALINCQTQAQWQNQLREELNVTLTAVSLFTGVISFFDNLINDRRWRYTFCELEVSCGDPGVPDNSIRSGDGFLYQDSVVYTCENGYYQSRGPVGGVRTCQDTGLWSDTAPECTVCTPIEFCEDVRCSNESNQYCQICESNYGLGFGESAYENLRDECLPLCSWLRSFCYPGNCTGSEDSCVCIDGFEGPDCLNLTNTVDTFSCQSMVAMDTSLQELPCDNDTVSPLTFINFIPTSLSVQWEVSFRGPTSVPAAPAYVTGFEVGVATSHLETGLYRASNPVIMVSSTQHNCSVSMPTPDQPIQTLVMCHVTAMSSDLSSHMFYHGDTFQLNVVAENGGFLDLNDFDAGVPIRHYYRGIPYIGLATYVLDLLSPTHCEVDPIINCGLNQFILEAGVEYTEEDDLLITWGGWLDMPSGLSHYVLDVYLLVYGGGAIMERTHPLVATIEFNDTTSQFLSTPISLPQESPYSLVLSVHDQAGNVQRARRLVLYDVNSTLEVDQSKPLVVTSAVPSTAFIWLNSTTQPLSITGRGHFYNTHMVDRDWLAPVASFYLGNIPTEYDHPLTTGMYPRNGTRNSQGVIQLDYTVIVDSEGGRSFESLTRPTSGWVSTEDIFLDNIVVPVSRTDGMSVRVWFRATDYKTRLQYDSVLVHVDSSPPVVRNLYIEHANVKLSLLGSRHFTDLFGVFDAYDEHSGLYRIEWSLGSNETATDIGSGRVMVGNIDSTSCSLPDCVCDSLFHCHPLHHSFTPTEADLSVLQARHDTDYYLTVIVTNNARISSSLQLRFTVDVTPPLEGVASEGGVGSYDIDYQNNLVVIFWWAGFFDRETDIAFYRYMISDTCQNSSIFTEEMSHQTSATSLSWTAPSTGSYVLSVVAYNNAQRPSAPVCSDGVTIDQEAPVVESFSVPSTVVTSSAWFVPYHSFVNFSWNALDDYGIADYIITIATTTLLLNGSADIQAPTGTGRTPFYTLYDPQLISGTTLFVNVLATDFAGNTGSRMLGPVVMDTSPPTFKGNITITYDDSTVTATWLNAEIEEVEEGIDSVTVKYAFGTAPYGEQIVPFTAVTPGGGCPGDRCVVLETTDLINGDVYYLTVQVTNHLGLSSVETSDFTFLANPPSPGHVFDVVNVIDLNDTIIAEDVDMVTDPASLYAVWQGFAHPSLPVGYSVGLGTQPGDTDVLPLTTVGMDTWYAFPSLPLLSGQTYFVIVVAEVDSGTTSAVSDGVTVLLNVEVLLDNVTISVEDQNSASVVQLQWSLPSDLLTHISHYTVALYTEDNSTFERVTDLVNTGQTREAILADVMLSEVVVYAGVDLCHRSACLPRVYSATPIQLVEVPHLLEATGVYTPSDSTVSVVWITSNESASIEWTIGHDQYGGSILLPWQPETITMATVPFPLDAQVETFVTVRFTEISIGDKSKLTVPLMWSVDGEIFEQEDVMFERPIVRDILPSSVPVTMATTWQEVTYSTDEIVDIDYTSSANQIAAAWPSLRFKSYAWSVTEQPNFLSCDQAIACGDTFLNYVTVSNLQLEHGHTYFMCLRVLPSDAIEPDVIPSPRRAVHCTDGVLVVSELPRPSSITATPFATQSVGTSLPCCPDKIYQTSRTELYIKWEEFSSVATGYHASSIAYYEYAIGTAQRESDITPYTNVGVAYETMVTNLDLFPGIPYYVTVRGIDLVGGVSYNESNPVVIDTTPPTITNVWMYPEVITSLESVTVEWTPVIEKESCLATIEVSLGTLPGYSDVSGWEEVDPIIRELIYTDSLNVADGDSVFANIKVTNVLGLQKVYSSNAYTVDTTPPIVGVVRDGMEANDVDFTTSLNTLSAHWCGFTDADSFIEYSWSIGTCQGCGDVESDIALFDTTEYMSEGLDLVNGQKYYISVTACTDQDVCTSGHSNGIVVDSTPPVLGRVLDGYVPGVSHQPMSSFISVSWNGFYDLESGIAYHTLYVGVTPGDHSVVPPTNLAASATTIVIPLNMSLPSNTMLYSTLVAVNNAGLFMIGRSKGIRINEEFPVINSSPIIDVNIGGSLIENTQYSSNLIGLSWNVTPPTNDRIPQVYWSLIPSQFTTFPLPLQNSHLDGSLKTFVDLEDGTEYSLVTTHCSSAGLCVRGTSEAVLVDSSPPIDGYFAIDTASAFNLSRSVPGSMTWRNQAGRGYLSLAWLGFVDVHSGVREVWVTVGSEYLSSDLSDGPQLISSEGESSGQVVLTRRAVRGSVVYISMWAVNGVGLASKTVLGSFLIAEGRTSRNGSLGLVRSHACAVLSCMGHCTCGARGEKCVVDPSVVAQCREMAATGGSVDINLSDLSIYHRGGNGQLYTGQSGKLQAALTIFGSVDHLEWTVVLANQTFGSNNVWYPGQLNHSFIYTPTSPLLHGGRYQFLVRAWHSTEEYSEFRSESIMVDLIGPSLVRGRRVIEGDGVDVDYVSLSTLVLSWDRVFKPGVMEQELTFEIRIGTTPGGDDVISSTSTMATTINITLPILSDGNQYYTSVTATDSSGVTVTSFSDGFVYDTTPPTSGEIFEISTRQSNSTRLTWSGFYDQFSPISHYELAMTPVNATPTNEDYTPIGLVHFIDVVLTGDDLLYYIRAVDINGIRSNTSDWNSMLEDTDALLSNSVSRRKRGIFEKVLKRIVKPVGAWFKPNNCRDKPMGIKCLFEDAYNQIQNPSFENGNMNKVDEWLLSGSSVTVEPDFSDFPFHGTKMAALTKGSYVEQKVQLQTEQVYHLAFYVKLASVHSQPRSGWLTVGHGDGSKVSTLRFRVAAAWSVVLYRFQALRDEITIQIGNRRDFTLLLDNVVLSFCSESNDIDINSVFDVRKRWLANSLSFVYLCWNVDIKSTGTTLDKVSAAGKRLQKYGYQNMCARRRIRGHHKATFSVYTSYKCKGSFQKEFTFSSFSFDLTPPTFKDYTVETHALCTGSSLQVTWSATDEESGVSGCYSTLLSNGYPLSNYTYHQNLFQIKWTFNRGYDHAAVVLVCVNGAGLYQYQNIPTSIVPPLLECPILLQPDIIPLDPWLLHYPLSQSSPPSIYEIRINDTAVVDWIDLGMVQQLVLRDLALDPATNYLLELRTVSLEGEPDQTVTLLFNSSTDPPVDTGKPILAYWNVLEQLLTVNWTDKFYSSSSLTFEVSIGTSIGSGSVIRWFETRHTIQSFQHPHLLPSNDYFATISAFTAPNLKATDSVLIHSNFTSSYNISQLDTPVFRFLSTL